MAAYLLIVREKMNNLNSILIEGNMVRAPEFRTTGKGTPVCKFSLASNRYFKQNSDLEMEVSYFDTEAWGKLAESCHRLGYKGRDIRVVGRLKQERWQDRERNVKSKVVIVAEHIEFRPEMKKDTAAEETKEGSAAVENTEETEISEKMVPAW
jgi:single-strand DNA-binding protein